MNKNKCVFDEAEHRYFLQNEKGENIKELISVTTLLRKHGLSPDYSSVPSDILQAKAEYGQVIHKELEDYIKHGEIGFSLELQNFIYYCNGDNDFCAIDSEFMVHNDIVAGTVDLLAEDGTSNILGDFKTTATLHKETVSWQLSLYAYLYKQQYGLEIDKLQAFHFTNGELKVVDIDFKPLEEIEKLLEAERNGVIYEQRQLVVESDLMLQLAEAEEAIKHFELQKKEAEANAVKLRQKLLEAMQAQGIKSFENERLKISYIEPTTRETIDSKRLKEERPEIAAEYKKISKVKESVRITLKGV